MYAAPAALRRKVEGHDVSAPNEAAMLRQNAAGWSLKHARCQSQDSLFVAIEQVNSHFDWDFPGFNISCA
jgi:hypothetical protein